MTYKLKIEQKILEDNESFTNDSGNHECVVFVQQAAGAPATTSWRKGIKVLDAKPGMIAFGTAIATFDANGKYPSTEKHAAVYVSHTVDGIFVFDQWNSQGKVKKRKIRKKSLANRTVNDAAYYYVIN